ncbi:MAG: EAL domain-containing protein [Gammaproteobacteria bacterium]
MSESHSTEQAPPAGVEDAARNAQLFRTIAAVHAALMADLDEPALMQHLCDVLVEGAHFRMAWIGLIEPGGVQVRPAAVAGFQDGYLTRIDIRCDDSPQGQGPTGTAIRHGRSVINKDTDTNPQFAPWRMRAHRLGYRSSAATPIWVNSRCIGTLNLYSDKPHAFGPDEVTLLEKLAADLGAVLARRATETALRASEARHRHIASVTSDLLYAYMHNLRGGLVLEWLTGNVECVFGYSSQEILGCGGWRCFVHPEDLDLFDRNVARLKPGQASDCELRIIAKGGGVRYLHAYSKAVAEAGQRGSGVCHRIYGACQDVTVRRAAEERIAFLAHHDALTGLPNRILLQDRFEQALAFAERAQSHVAVLFVDLDNFKAVNDSLGHAAGDQLLQAIVTRLIITLRDTDTASRQGGDEFILLLNEIPNSKAVERIAATLLERLSAALEIDGHILKPSCSIGISLYPEDGRDFDSLLQRADMAMYKAKEAGRNTYRFFDAAMNLRAKEYLLLLHRLQQALENGEFSLHYQPQWDIERGTVIGVEALLRWHSPGLGEIPPERFIPIAEGSGLIIPLGDWVVREACHQLGRWRAAGLTDLSLSVNLSAVQFRRATLLTSVVAALDDSGLPAQLLMLELTESSLLQDVDNSLHTVGDLKALGVGLAIDDFGTGYSSLSYLKRLAVDKLKIDQSFVRDIGADPDDTAIVRAIIQLARSLHLGIIAEGVETPEQLAFLRREGCHEIQGYLTGRPLPATALEDLLRTPARIPWQ